MTEYDRQYCKTCGKVALALCLFYLLISTVASYLYAAYVSVLTVMNLQEQSEGILYTVVEIIGESAYMIAYFLSFAIPAFLLFRMLKKLPHTPMQWKKIPKPSVWLWIVGAVAVNFLMSFWNTTIMSWISPGRFSEWQYFAIESQPPSLHTVVLSFLSVGVVPALCEEYLFRGAVFSALRPYGKSTAIFGSAVLFGLMHQNPYQMLYTMALGLVLAVVYIQTETIWSCVLIHFFNNSLSVSLEVCNAYGWYVASNLIQVLLMLVGLASVVYLVIRLCRRPKVTDHGSFGVLFEAEPDYSAYPLSNGMRWKGFFHPAMIVFFVLTIGSIVSTALIFGGFGL